MKLDVSDVAAGLGLVAIGAGVFLLFGLPVLLIVAGLALLAGALARREPGR
jgi:hypothetical protein